MLSPEIYVLDSNVFIQAARQYYAFDIVPSFWVKLEEQAANGRIVSIDRVKAEIDRGDDELKEWVNSKFGLYFKSTQTQEVIEAYKEVIKWVANNNQYNESAKCQFANGADGWLVAYAKTYGYIVVTHEKRNPETKNKVPIPNVCVQFRVTYVDTFKMLRNLGVQF